jgi:hypothetical protein
MIINGGELAILLGSAVVLTGTAVWGARRAVKGLIAMKKSGEYDAIAKEFKEKSVNEWLASAPVAKPETEKSTTPCTPDLTHAIKPVK